MDINEILYFKTVADLEHITKAAEHLHMAQPALSKSISKLESELGVKLFERDGNRIFLNAYGRTFLRHADQILSQINNSIKEVNDMAGKIHGSITIAISVPSVINRFLHEYLPKNRNISFKQLSQSPQQMKEGLENHEIDFAISTVPIESPSIIWQPLYNDEQIMLVNDTHRLAGIEAAELREFSEDRFIVNNSGSGHRETFEQMCKAAGFTPKIMFEGNEPTVIIDLVSNNYGICMVPSSIVNWFRDSGAPSVSPSTYIRIKDEACVMNFGIARIKNHYLSKAALHFYEELMSFYQPFTVRDELLQTHL
ncbi:MAG: LysR family transcriptional regulator [Clostridiales bacterium]|nr:LysR family transcriptional regulator [Clostridiales bacterium]